MLGKVQARTPETQDEKHLVSYESRDYLSGLQVQSFRLTLTLRLHHTLPRASEVGHVDSHSALTQRSQPSLGANSLDIRTTEVILLRNEFIKIHILSQTHLARVQREDLLLGVLVRVLEQDFPIDTTGTDERWIQGFNLVRGHDDFDVASVVEAVELIEEFEHGSLDFSLAA